MQQRQSVRFQIRLPVISRWIDEQAGDRQCGGFTRDISRHGLFAYSLDPPPLGATVEFEVMLPALEPAGHGVRLRSFGRVLRVEQEEETRTGFAATGEFDLPNSHELEW